MSILDFFKRDKSQNKTNQIAQGTSTSLKNYYENLVEETNRNTLNLYENKKQENYTEGLPGASNTVGTISENVHPTSLAQYHEGAKNLKKIEELYPSVSETIDKKEIFHIIEEGVTSFGSCIPRPEEKKLTETLVQTWGHLPNSQESKTSTFEEFYEICIKNRLDTLENTVKIMGEYVSQLLLDVEKLQFELYGFQAEYNFKASQLDKRNKPDNAFIKKPPIKAFDNDRIYLTPLGKLYGKDYIYKTTEAILDVLKNNKKELHMKDIFSKIKHYKLKNPNVNYDTVKSIVYSLVKKEKIKHGLQYGCFKIIKSTKDI